MLDKIRNELQGKSPDKIYELLHSSDEKYPDKNGYALCDAASLFVAFAYFAERPSDKQQFRAEAYSAFLDCDRSRFPHAWAYLDMLSGGAAADGLRVRILKGGSYKIKNYYLENNVLDDMRGASALLSYVEEQLVPEMISHEFIRECIIYCGGGNVFAALPEWADDSFALRLEQEAQRVLLTANTAYYMSDAMPLSAILGEDYKRNMTEVEERLAERKKLRIFADIKPVSTLVESTLDISGVGNVKFSVEEITGTHCCEACGKRMASYRIAGSEDRLCGGCMHKRTVGDVAKDGKYCADFRRINHHEPAHTNCLTDIDGDYVAVVYADGNNMGGIIAGFRRITEMMSFSRDVREVTAEALFRAMEDVGIDRFEVVALGGDDVFVIVPGNKAYAFTMKLVERYNSFFTQRSEYSTRSTLSAGIAIAKSSTPVRIMLEKAEEQLDSAKYLEKNRDAAKRDGTLSFVIMDSYGAGDDEKEHGEISSTMLPYSLSTAKQVAGIVSGMDGTAKSRLRNILDAFRNADSTEEANLFLRYMNAKSNADKRIALPEISGFTLDGGYYVQDEKYSYIWNDLLELSGFIDGVGGAE